MQGNYWKCKEWLLKEPSQLSQKAKSIYLHKLGEMKCENGFLNQQISSLFAAHIVTSGQGYFKSNERTYDVKTGDIFFFFPNKFYQYGMGKSPHWNFTWLNMIGPELINILTNFKIDYQNPIIYGANMELINPILKKCQMSLGYTIPLQSSPIQLAWSFIEYLEKNHSTSIDQLDIAEQTKWLIDNDSHNFLTVQGLAEQLEYTRASIFRLFKDKYNISPKDYMDKIRIEKASAMLVSTKCSIKEISSSLGFTNPNYFARAFRKYTMINPMEFRKKHLQL